jgi:hypothetical protein
MSGIQPSLEYLFACSLDAVESYVLSRQTKLANAQRLLGDLLDEWLQTRKEQYAGSCVLDFRRTSTQPRLSPLPPPIGPLANELRSAHLLVSISHPATAPLVANRDAITGGLRRLRPTAFGFSNGTTFSLFIRRPQRCLFAGRPNFSRYRNQNRQQRLSSLRSA